MKIGIYDPYLDDAGGGEKYMMSIASCLSDTHEVDVFWDKPQDLDQIEKRFSLDLSKVSLKKNIFSLRTSLAQRLLLTLSYDRIIVLSDGSIPLVASKKLFIHIQQPLDALQVSSLADKVKLARVSKFFCNSIYTQSYISKRFPIKPIVIYPPISLFPKKIKKENNILHVGRFRVMDPLTHAGDFKKQHIMIEAFKQMIDAGLKNWKFILAVSVRDEEMKVFEEMKKKTVGYPIMFLVNKTNEELWNAYSKAKIYWHASGYGEDLAKHPEFAEHFGISTVEAMGAGCVPIVINAGGQKEIVENNKNGLVWDNLEDLKKMTMQVIKDSKLWQRLSKEAVSRASEFAGDKFCTEVTKLIQ